MKRRLFVIIISDDGGHFISGCSRTSMAASSWSDRGRLEPIMEVGHMLKNGFWLMINAIIFCISNAVEEARNVRIQWIKKIACEFRNRE